MQRIEAAVIGAGPAGLSAAIEIARAGGRAVLIDENSRPGGQLFKQIHKFFGSREHKAGTRGFRIGTQLLDEASKLGIETLLDTAVCGIYGDKRIWAVEKGCKSLMFEADKIIISTGATENAITFPGWTLPGVMGAGAAQTMINVNRVLPGKRVLMVGSGNVGVIVSYQLLQAGADVAAIVEAAPKLGGYGVHTAKVRRAGVPFFTSHTVKEVIGKDQVEKAIIVELDEDWHPVEGTEKEFDVDTVCFATGLTPLAELAWQAGCRFLFIRQMGGHIPWHDRNMQTSVPGIYIAGDISGIEEASTAMEEGKLAGVAAAAALGYYSDEEAENLSGQIWRRLDMLRCGPFGEGRKKAKEAILAQGGAAVWKQQI